MNKGIRRKINKESIALIVVLSCIAGFVFYLLFLSDKIGLKIKAEIETSNTYIKRMDSVLRASESTKNAVLEALVNRDAALELQEIEIQAKDSLANLEIKQLNVKLDLVHKNLLNKDAKIDSLIAVIDTLKQVKRSSIEQDYK